METRNKFLRLFFKSEDETGYYPVTECPCAEVDYTDENDVAIHFLRLTHSSGWLDRARRRMRFGDRISIGDTVYEYKQATQGETKSLPGLWSAYQIERVPCT